MADGLAMPGDERAPRASALGHPAVAGIKVAHLTSHHDILDNRIFYRECRSLVEAGFTVLLIAQHDRDETRDGVQILAVPRYRNRLERVTLTAARVAWRALRSRAAIYHFHDPELIPWCLLLRLLGKRVIYDVHEDFGQAARVRPWLPVALRPLLAAAIQAINHLARHAFSIVIAERYYARSFPGATEVLNYARLDFYAGFAAIDRAASAPDHIRLIYSGSVTDSRGAQHHLRLLDHLPDTAELLMIGQCNGDDLRKQLRDRAAADRRLRLEIGAAWVPYTKIVEAYRQPWLAGLVIFPDAAHYREKELTKFFEYMAAGLPIICSHFPAWRELIEGNGLGLCVDPEDPAAAAAAVRWLVEHPEDARAMGERGRKLVETRFNWSTQADNLIAHYERLLGLAAGPLTAGAPHGNAR